MVCIVIVLAWFYAHIDKNTYIYNRDTDTAQFIGTGVLTNGEEIVQTFKAEEDTIDGMNVKVALSEDVKGVELHCSVTEIATNKTVSSKIAADKLEHNKFNILEIPKIEDAKGKLFAVKISVKSDEESKGVAFYLEPGRHNGQELSVKGNDTDATLMMRSVCNRFDVETFVVVLGLIAFVVGFMKVLYKFFK